MNVSGIFKILITAVACVLIGAFVLNMLVPNALMVMTGSVENAIHSATGIALDINGDGQAGEHGTDNGTMGQVADDQTQGFNVDGAHVGGMEP